MKKDRSKSIRFLVVGAVATLLDFGLLFVFSEKILLPVIIANIGSTAIAFCFSFFANKKYTFRTKETNLVREIVLFSIVTLFGLWVLQSLVIHFVLPVLNNFEPAFALLIAKLLATVITTIWNYLLYSRVVFNKTTDQRL